MLTNKQACALLIPSHADTSCLTQPTDAVVFLALCLAQQAAAAGVHALMQRQVAQQQQQQAGVSALAEVKSIQAAPHVAYPRRTYLTSGKAAICL
jgi:hypothetical protein